MCGCAVPASVCVPTPRHSFFWMFTWREQLGFLQKGQGPQGHPDEVHGTRLELSHWWAPTGVCTAQQRDDRRKVLSVNLETCTIFPSGQSHGKNQKQKLKQEFHCIEAVPVRALTIPQMKMTGSQRGRASGKRARSNSTRGSANW